MDLPSHLEGPWTLHGCKSRATGGPFATKPLDRLECGEIPAGLSRPSCLLPSVRVQKWMQEKDASAAGTFFAGCPHGLRPHTPPQENVQSMDEGDGECVICRDSSPSPIQSRCACRGPAGLAHTACRAQAAGAQASYRGYAVWWECHMCKQNFTGEMHRALAEAWWSRVHNNTEEDNEMRRKMLPNPSRTKGSTMMWRRCIARCLRGRSGWARSILGALGTAGNLADVDEKEYAQDDESGDEDPEGKGVEEPKSQRRGRGRRKRSNSSGADGGMAPTRARR